MAAQLDNLTPDHLGTLTLAELDGMTLAYLAAERLTLDQLDTLDLAELDQLDLPLTREGVGRGAHVVRNAWGGRGRGAHYVLLGCSGTGRGLHRVANLSLVAHRLLRGRDASPDPTADPWDEWPALGAELLTLDELESLALTDLDTLRLDDLPYPHTTPALLGLSYLDIDDLDGLSLDELEDLHTGGATYRLACRKRNAWSLTSANLGSPNLEGVVIVADDGSEGPTPPSAPTEIDIAAADGAFLVTAKYCYRPDGSNAADTWDIYFTSDGADPDLGGSPVEVAIAKADGVARLATTTAAFAPGTTGKAVVRVDRDGTESTNTAIVSAVAATAGPAAPDAAAHFAALAGQA